MNDDTVPIKPPQFRGSMVPLPKGHPARPVNIGRRQPFPPRARTDWTELGWYTVPWACAAAAMVLVYVLGTT